MYGLTTKYNIHFNGEEAYKQGLASMEKNYDDDYSRQLKLHPVYSLVNKKEISSNPDFERAIEKCKKSVQTRSITNKPKRKSNNSKEYREWLTHGEFNPFMHNVWFLSGQAQFYEGDFGAAQATFSYTARHFWWEKDIVADCHIWSARCLAVQGFVYEAEAELNLVIPQKRYNSQAELSKLTEYQNLRTHSQREFSMAQAEILLQKKGSNVNQIIEYLRVADKAWRSKEQRIRAKFLIAQLYEQEDNLDKAHSTYGEIIRSAKSYKTQFNARIAQTRVMQSKNLAKTEKKLNLYRRQSRNAEYLDQIYYALGNVSLQRRDTSKAIQRYEEAIKSSTRNSNDKAIAALKLGELTFEQEDYVKAQKAYSTAMSIIKDDYPSYSEISRLSRVLDELQTHAETVELQDSLLYLASMSDSERDRVIDKIIKDLIKAEKEAADNEKLAAYNDRVSQNVNPLDQNTQQPIVGEKDDSWYFYNTAMVNLGKTEFQKRWGARKPEDDWRRRNKSETAFFETEEPAENELAENEEANDSIPIITNLEGSDDPHNPAYYLAQIPFSEEAKANANSLIEDGMYNMGVIINEKLENFPLSIKTFKQLEQRYPETDHRLDFYYAIYLMYMRMGQPDKAESYRQKLMQFFPESSYGVAVSDPNYIDNLRHMAIEEDSLYRETYEAYLANESEKVHRNYEFVHEKWPLSKLMPKFLFLHSLSYVQEGNTEAFKESLEQLTATYPQSDVSPLAGQMVKGIHEGRNIQTGETAKGLIWNNSLRVSNDSAAVGSSMIFVDNDDITHVLLLAFKTDSVSQNDILFEVAKFNFENYLIKDFDLEIIKTGDLSVLVISSFENLDELIEYHDRMDASASIVLPDGIYMIDISEPNFRALLGGKTFDEYFQWVQETYGE